MERSEEEGCDRKRKSHLYHVCTDGLSRSVMFRDDTDYIFGMNDIPLCSCESGIKIYCFCLMSNHVHFILNGNEAECLAFIRKYKRLRSFRMRNRYGQSMYSGNSAHISLKRLDDIEYQLNAMAYVMRNPLAAGIRLLPWQYPWGSAALYFSHKAYMAGYRKLSELDRVSIISTLKTRMFLPGNYLIRDDGLIWPGSYVDYPSVENLFGSPRKFLYYLSRNQDMENEIADGVIARSRYSDYELSVSAESLCLTKFGKSKPCDLDIERRYLLARELRRRYGVSAKQIARVIGLDAGILKSIL